MKSIEKRSSSLKFEVVLLNIQGYHKIKTKGAIEHMQKKRCSYTEDTPYGVKTVYLENDLLRVGILPEKGADIFEFFYKQVPTEFMMRTGEGLKAFEGRDFKHYPLKHYAEIYIGGWQDILPNRAQWDHGSVGQTEEGESVGISWDYEVIVEEDKSVCLWCCAQLPNTPFLVEKRIELRDGAAAFTIKEQVTNVGTDTVRFTWTHHPAFGGDFLDERVEVMLPPCKAFNVGRYEADREKGLGAFEEEVESVTLPSGRKYNLLKVNPRGEGEGCYITLKDLEVPMAGLYNPDKSLGVQLEWDKKAFPYLRYWSCNTEKIYTVALEPSSSYFSHMDDSIRHNAFLSLGVGERLETWIKCSVVI